VEALSNFRGIKRRLELLGEPGGVAVYDDFAHHPTAIEATLGALRAMKPRGKLVAIVEPRSNTMRMGLHRDSLAAAAQAADNVLWYEPEGLAWDLSSVIAGYAKQRVVSNVEQIVEIAHELLAPGDSVVVMSNGGFEGLHGRLLTRLGTEVHQ
jgi:UDP-N-acetylmuramate: L-alanyl-gamma-D-glutamyl-meso-diaminopimelate ligase